MPAQHHLPEALFFDVDGVLIDSMQVKGEAFAQAFDDFPGCREAIIALHLANGGVTRSAKIGLIYETILNQDPQPTDINSRVAAFSRAVVERVIAAPEIPGASEALGRWAQKSALHAVSATPTEELLVIFDRRGMTGYFRSVQGWPPKKGDAVRQILADFGYNPDHCVLIGDSPEDSAAAQTAGVRFVQVSASPASDFVHINAVIRDLHGLDDAINRVLAEPSSAQPGQ